MHKTTTGGPPSCPSNQENEESVMGWPRRGRGRFVAVNGRSSKEKAPDNGAEGRAGHARHETQLKPFSDPDETISSRAR